MRQPNFGTNVDSELEPCSPHSLYLSLLDAEANVGHYKPAYEFAQAAFSSIDPDLAQRDAGLDQPASEMSDITNIDSFIDSLTGAARQELSQSLAMVPEDVSNSWCIRLVKEFAPLGLIDGAWLHGMIKLNVVEDQAGMLFLKQFMMRFGDPELGPSQRENYATLCKSLGVSPDLMQRYNDNKSMPCSEISFEYALLPLTSGLFPNSFRYETAGLNLWLSSFGPCPLIRHLCPRLAKLNASLSYFDAAPLQDLARQTVVALMQEGDGLEGDDATSIRARVTQGFLCAHHWYLRWQKAMLGRNIPMQAREFVHELFTQKAPHTLGHHDSIKVNGRSLEAFFNADSPSNIDELIDNLAQSRHIVPGNSEKSSLLNVSLSLDGPMFGVFSSAELQLLREWVDSLEPELLDQPPSSEFNRCEPVTLVGLYTQPQNMESLGRYANDHFSGLSDADLYYWLVNADLHPPVRLFAKHFVSQALDQLRGAFQKDPQTVPSYSERQLALLVSNYQSDTVSIRRERAKQGAKAESFVGKSISGAGVGFVFDGSWVQGMADANNADQEEYQWLFKIYASELGDGCLEWNHNVIAIEALKEYGYRIEGSRLEPSFYDSFSFPIQHMVSIAVSLNTRYFLPEILGINLSIEVQGVGGDFIEKWKDALKQGHKSMATYSRLHNSIDNFSSGHAKMSQDAVKAFMSKVAAYSPNAVDEVWDRIWTIWRFQEIAEHGSKEEKGILEDLMGTNYLSMSAASGVELVTQK